ncbi:glyoxalase [Nocardioides gansuensis]|uniref:Glyoxalase n=1 Tax=Nocardioides gansuensis TaxID=2138300 RepID=A0A2T8FD00_9ACTN|nr:VOC family protein [Nocardioides gansuensis]PVG83587.1 glyoxalase [Nocardioides gansuensis]
MASGAAVSDRIRRLDHVAVATVDMEPAARLFVDVLGGRMLSGGDNDETGTRLMQIACGGFKVELMQPLRNGSTLARHLRKRGEGLHHLTYMVDDVPSTVSSLAELGYETVGTDASSANWAETFLSPRQSFGALIQFCATTLRFDVETEDYGVDDVLAGRVVWRDRVACLRTDAR